MFDTIIGYSQTSKHNSYALSTINLQACLFSLSAAKISPTKRDCRFRNENQDMKLFNQYSQNGCMFECQIAMATKKCGCVPWDYPHLRKSGLSDVCDGWGKHCFEGVMKDATKRLANCKHCLPDCSITR